MRVLHYVNQFFGGIGGDDQADHAPELREEPVGPGRLLNNLLGEDGSVVATLICGDKFFQGQQDTALGALKQAISEFNPDVVIAGPAFDSTLYGFACAEVAKTAQEAGVPALVGMAVGNLAAPAYAPEIYIIDSGSSPASMGAALGSIVTLARKLAAGEQIGSAEDDGYLPRDASEADQHAACEALLDEIGQEILAIGSRPAGFELAVAGEGESAALEQALEQGPVLVSVYKSSCQASKVAFPYFERLTQVYPQDQLTVWGVSLDSPRVTASFQRRYGITFPILLDEDGYPTARAFGVKETPSTFLIDKSGEVVWNAVAFEKSGMDELSEQIAELLATAVVDITSGTEDLPDSVHG